MTWSALIREYIRRMLDFKLRPPTSRAGLVVRRGVLDRLHSASQIPVVSILAPPGYGKTTVMGQFRAERAGSTGWLTLDESDSDPSVLLTSVVNALLAAGLLEEGALTEPAMRSDTVLTTGVDVVAAALLPTRPGALFLDQVDHLHTQSALDVIGAIMARMAGPIQVLVASRSGAGLPLSLLRSQGVLFELTTADLAMDEQETAEVFAEVGVPVDRGLDAVMEQTEGWPAGIYLTAMAIKAGAPTLERFAVRGDDFYLADYLRQELLGQIPDELMSFLARSSVLSRLSGPLCDFVLERDASAETLANLEGSNLLIVPLDRTRTWYRYHSLLLDFLRADLERRHPEEQAPLHSRAATWFEDHGFPELAMYHMQSAGEGERFAEMVSRSGRRVYAEGRMETLSGWLRWLEDNKVIADFPELAAVGGFARSLEGDPTGAERMASLVFTDPDGHTVDDADLGPFARIFRSFQAARGVELALTDARMAIAALGQSAEWLHVAMGAEAIARLASDGIDSAEALWTDALWRSEALQAHPFTSIGLAERALAAIERNDWANAETMVDRALTTISEGGLERYATSGLGLCLAARIAARRGEVEEARSLMSQAVAIRPLLTVAIPLLSVQTLLEMAKAHLELADIAGARRVMRDAADIIAIRPRLGRLIGEYETLRERLSSLPPGSVGPSSLTSAELRLLPLLVTHLTYPEIGERLFVSRHTVKTQAMSIYRKLAVSSRTAAVAKAREVGLISV